MISSEEAERALDWMVSNAVLAAKARAERLYLEQFLKVRRAEIMVDIKDASVAAAEVIALASPKYKEILDAYRTAVENDERIRFLYTAAESRIDAWRTQESSLRAMTK